MDQTKKYVKPDVETEKFNAEDVVLTSAGDKFPDDWITEEE